MRRLAVATIAAALLSAAIPAEASIAGRPAGTTGRGGRTTLVCVTSKAGKHATNCPTVPTGTTGNAGTFWP